MKYLSTRGDKTSRGFCDILLEGLAPDGGLYLPESYPKVDAATLARWRGLSYADLAFEVLSLYIDDIPAVDLKALVARTYTPEVFGTDAITPLKPIEDGVMLQALSNGPTLAFKDMAMQLLGQLFEVELARRGQVLNILGATSGDTGSAAEYAMRGKRGVNVFMLSPQGRMSPFQQAQMFSLHDANIHNIVIAGVFDDCQDIVKAVSSDLDFKHRWHIGTVNSINWARLLAQVVYYFAGYFQATRSDDEQVDFAVPSGNFGNICAGHVARMMGLPIRRLVLATNENNVLDEFFRTGIYRVRSSGETVETSSPSMDISKASNVERFVFDLLGRDATRTRELFRTELAANGVFTLTPDETARIASFGFVSGCSTHADRLATIHTTFERSGTVIDPHTADGLKVALEHRSLEVPMIVLETAQPAKFAATIVEAIGREPARPAAMVGIEDLPKRFVVLPANARSVMGFIEQNAWKVVGFSGYSGSGKTTLIEQLILTMKARGVRVSVVKHAHHAFDIDREGKDSWRHRRAGAFEVVIASDRRLALMREYDAVADPSVHDLIAELGACDWVFVEGFKHAVLPKLEIWRESAGHPVRYADDPQIVAVCTDDPSRLPVATRLPVLDLNQPDAVLAFLFEQPDRYEYHHAAIAAVVAEAP